MMRVGSKRKKGGEKLGRFADNPYLCIKLKVFYQRCNTKSVMDLWQKKQLEN